MRFRNWLLTGTSLGILVFAPVTIAQAQDAALIAAYEGYVAASSSGDADATAAAEATFLGECARVGVANAGDCIALIQNGGAQPAEAAPPAEVQAEEAPPAEVVPEAPPAEVAPEQPMAVEQPPAEVVVEAPPPAVEEPAPEAVTTQQVAPEQQPAAEQPPAEAQPPAEQQPPAEETPMQVGIDYPTTITDMVTAYNDAVGAYVADNMSDEVRAIITNSPQQITDLCVQAGYADLDACLATLGLTMAPAPDMNGGGQMAVEQQPPVDLPGADEAAGNQQVEILPDVAPEEAAPLLDSVKDIVIDGGDGTVQAEAVAAPTEPPPPAPETDEAAQAEIQPEQIVSLQAEEGQRIEAAPVAEVPQNVTIINNTTVVNNTTVNNTTNNTTNNDNSSVNQANFQVVFQIGTQLLISNQEQERDRFREDDDEIYYEQLGRGRVRETIERPDGSRLVTIRNRNGDILQRSRFTPDGREIVLAYFDDRYDEDLLEWRDPGDDLPPLYLTISARDYVLDAEEADEEEVEVFFRQPPVEQVRRLYSIDEVKRSARIRDSVRRLEVGGLTFDSGAATISRDQVGALSKVAAGMLKLLERNPGETFLIEGHSDAVGSDISNLRLSDLRAATVARILTDFYEIPPENLATQGYGERYLKVKTEDSERLNRRVTIRRVTPLITPVASR